MNAHRLPPHDLDAEKSVIGAMLLSSEALTDILAILEPGDFYSPKHQLVFAAILTLRSTGQPIDAVTVSSELKPNTTERDWLGLLLEAQAFCPSISGAERYATIVADAATRRRLIALASDVMEASYSPKPTGEIIDSAKTRMTETALRASNSDVLDKLTTFSQFVIDQAAHPIEMVIPRVIGRRERLLIVAPEGAGKGVLMRQLAIAVAGGVHPFTQEPIEPLPTLYMDLENEDRTIAHQASLTLEGGRRMFSVEPDAWILSHPEGLNLRKTAVQVYVERAMQAVRPAMLCIGPIYKAARKHPNETWEDATLELFAVLDDLRTRYNCCLVMEHHAPKGSGVRDLLPFGSSAWLRWPEYGWKLEPSETDRQGNPLRLAVGTFRGNRMETDMPDLLVRGGRSNLPWVAQMKPR